jgi:hypothetical protein
MPFLKSATRSLDFATRGEDVFMVISSAFHAIKPLTEITQPCVHMCNGLFICQLYSLPNLLEEMDCKEDTPLTLPFCIIRVLLTVDNSDMN